MNLPAGHHLVRALARHGVDTLFTLSGGHVFPIYDGAVKEEVQLLDVRHEQTAAFAAEAVGKLTGAPGVAVVTAGPGVTNTVSAVAAAHENGSPLMLIGGRAPQFRWGQGSLQEFDHVPVLRPVTKVARTVTEPGRVVEAVDDAMVAAATPKQGPCFLDIGIDVQVSPVQIDHPPLPNVEVVQADSAQVESVADLLDQAERPIVIAGSAVHLAGAHAALVRLAEAAGAPVFVNGLARGAIPPRHSLAFTRARSAAFRRADLVVVVGTPLDFRLGFGQFGDARVVHIVDHGDGVATHVDLAGSIIGSLPSALDALAAVVEARDRSGWVAELTAAEQSRRTADRDLLTAQGDPIHPGAVYGALDEVLDNDTIVIGDGGDFVSFAGRFIEPAHPGRWLDAGPFGCLGSGLGYVLGASVAAPGHPILALMGDGAFGFAGMEIDTLVRHGIDATIVIGNNGIWGLEKHPMQAFYGYDVVADLQAACRYDLVAEALGARGWFVDTPQGLRAALGEAMDHPGPAVVNVITDPAIAYPRSSTLV